jgi:hypothetical protein
MKKKILIVGIFLYSSVLAVEGYKDIYITSNKNIYIHTIYCAKDLTNLSALRPSVVYTNTKSINDGTYYIKSTYINTKFGEYSATFKKIEGQSNSLRVRGILTKGQTLKSQMKKEVCLVEKSPKLPKDLNDKIKQDVILSNDVLWNKKMENFTKFFGKPAYAKDKYLNKK